MFINYVEELKGEGSEIRAVPMLQIESSEKQVKTSLAYEPLQLLNF